MSRCSHSSVEDLLLELAAWFRINQDAEEDDDVLGSDYWLRRIDTALYETADVK